MQGGVVTTIDAALDRPKSGESTFVRRLLVALSKKTVARKTERLAILMASIHGGEWTTHIDHESGFILIRLLQAQA